MVVCNECRAFSTVGGNADIIGVFGDSVARSDGQLVYLSALVKENL